MATVETSQASAALEGSIVLQAHRGANEIPITLHYSAVRELRELADRPNAQVFGLLRGRWNRDGIVLEHAGAETFEPDALGIFRLQPGGWATMTPADCKKLRAVGLIRGVVLVVRPLEQRPWSATLFTVEPDTHEAETPLAEFPWDEYLLQNGWLTDLTPPDTQRLVPASQRRHSRPLWAGAAMVLIAACGAAVYHFRPALRNQPVAEVPADPPAAASPALRLNVVRQAQVLAVDTPPPVSSPAPPPLAPRNVPTQRPSVAKDASTMNGWRRLGAIAPTPERNGAVPVRRSTPQLTGDLIREMNAAHSKVLVSVLISIDAAGKVEDARVLASSGEGSAGGTFIRLASLAAARQWRFRPATAQGKPVPSEMTVLFTF